MQAATADVGEARHYTRSPTPASADCVIQVPGYLIKREIGAGGMATVYSAVQTSLEREVALKVMNPAMVSDPTFSRRFMQEARTLASLAHPNIVAVYDVGITDEKPLKPDPLLEKPGRCAEVNPAKDAYFGDLHVHTSLSLDANLQGNRLTVADA